MDLLREVGTLTVVMLVNSAGRIRKQAFRAIDLARYPPLFATPRVWRSKTFRNPGFTLNFTALLGSGARIG